jgi:hypothetical protein
MPTPIKRSCAKHYSKSPTDFKLIEALQPSCESVFASSSYLHQRKQRL